MPRIEDYHIARLFLAGLAIVTIVDMFLGGNALDPYLLPCVIRKVTGVPCPGCGMTHACLALAKGEWSQAWIFHPLVYGLIPLATVFAFAPKRLRAAWSRIRRPWKTTILLTLLVGVVGLWIFRLCTHSIP